MTGEVWHRARLDIARKIGLNADTLLHEIIDQGHVLHRAHPMADTLRSEQAQRIPHALRSGAFSGMNSHTPSRITSAREMFDEKLGRKLRFVASQIESN